MKKWKFDKRDDMYIWGRGGEFPIVKLAVLGNLSFILYPNANSILESVTCYTSMMNNLLYFFEYEVSTCNLYEPTPHTNW